MKVSVTENNMQFDRQANCVLFDQFKDDSLEMENMESAIEELLEEILPHGSGLDYDYTVTLHANGNVSVLTDYYLMNDHGYYCGNTPVKIRIFKYRKTVLNRLKGPSLGNVQVVNKSGDIDFKVYCVNTGSNGRYGLRDYLEDLFYDSLQRFTNTDHTTITVKQADKMVNSKKASWLK